MDNHWRWGMDIKSIYKLKIKSFLILSFVIIFQSNFCMAAKPMMVNMYDDYFEPSTITVSPNQKIIWMNKGKKDHNVTSDNGELNSGSIRPGGSVSYTFTKPGVYPYKCTIHSFMSFGMKGKVIVQ
jgi:plastocyanin